MMFKLSGGKSNLKLMTHTKEVLELRTTSVSFARDEPPMRISMLVLSEDFRHLLIDAGLGYVSRVHKGIGVPFDLQIDQFHIVDGFVRLPEPAIYPKRNKTGLKEVVKQYEELFDRMIISCHAKDFNDMCYLCQSVVRDDDVVCSGIQSVRQCFQRILREELPLYTFETLFSHPFFRSSTSKISYLKGAVYYLQSSSMEGDYSNYHASERQKLKDLIKKAIVENIIVDKVFNYGGEVDTSKDRYSAFSLLQLMANFAEHATDHRPRKSLLTDDELVGILEYHFQTEINNSFFFFWDQGINCDWDRSLRRYAEPPHSKKRNRF